MTVRNLEVARVAPAIGLNTGARVAIAIAWPAALVAAVYAAVGRLGFYPQDEGLVQAYTWRILHGEVPHRDFISPRPLGSALIHIIDFAIPGPLFEVSRVIALGEYALYSILFAWLVFELAPWRWGALAIIGVAGSILINLNVFPLMSWYTVDGLALIAGGYLVIARGVRLRNARAVGVGFAIVGIAAVTKQSFVPAAAFGWFLLWPWLREMSWFERFRAGFLTGVCASLPLLAFTAVIAALGGFTAMRTQLFGGEIVYGRPLAAAWSPHHDLWVMAPLFFVTAGLTAGAVLTRKSSAWSLLFRAAISALVLAVPLWARLGVDSLEWSIELTWVVIAFIGVRYLLLRSFDPVGPLLIGVAWMSMLSWGWAWPTFTVGTAALYVLQRTWSDAVWPERFRLPADAAATVAAALVLVLTAGLLVTSRDQRVYLDLSASHLTASLGDVSPAFGGIRTNPVTHDYLMQMQMCVRQHPARHVAILPENPAMYPALGISDPFPIDWMYPDDMRGSEARILAAADQLNREGDYLVLFQTVGQRTVVGASGIPDATQNDPVYAYGPNSLPARIYAKLNGQRSTCGSFLVVYQQAAFI